MPTIEIHLRPADTPLPVAAAWLHQADARRWLAELRQVVDALREAAPSFISQLQLFVTPRSATNREGSGLMIVLPRDLPALRNPFSPGATLLGWHHRRVLIPCGSRVFPALDPAEAKHFFPYACHFFHPTEGLIGFEESDRISAADLLVRPEIAGEDWSGAVPPPPPVPRLARLELHIPGNLDDLMDEIAGEIGEARNDPAKSGEGGPIKRAGTFLAGLGAGMLGGMAAGLRKLIGGGKAGEEQWLDKIAKWGAKQWQELNDARQRELNRLLKLFESDPQEALRHALPLAGDAPRGAAPPSTRLSSRDPRFTFGRGRGGPADQWNLDREMRESLERRYREAAQRAMAGGEWERAAYIYGELLGDWARAAAALGRGGRPRDAARIYLERLSNKLLAAQCLADAGLLWEAIALYRELAHHEILGDLLNRLGQTEEAQIEYRMAINAAANPLEKARILETKCLAPDEALAVLGAAWPHTAHACECLEAHFALLGRLERHALAVNVVQILAYALFNNSRDLLDVLLKVARTYPHPDPRREVAPVAFAIVGRELSRADRSEAERRQLLQQLPKFAPEDRLLERDAVRFQTKRPPASPVTSSSPARHSSLLHPSTTHTLALDADWQSLSWGAHRLSLAGLKDGHLAVGVVLPGSAPQLLEMQFPRLADRRSSIRHVVAGVHGGACARIFHEPGKRQIYFYPLATYPTRQHEQLSAIPEVLAVSASGPDQWALLRVAETGGILVEFYDVSGASLRHVLIDYANPEHLANAHLVTRRRSIWIGVGSSLCWNPAEKIFKVIGLDAPVSSLTLAPEAFGEQVLATADEQVTLITVLKSNRHEVETVNLLGGTSTPAVATFTNDGCAVALNEDGGVLYDVKSGLREIGRIVWPPANGRPIAIAPFGDVGFAVLAENRALLLYRA